MVVVVGFRPVVEDTAVVETVVDGAVDEVVAGSDGAHAASQNIATAIRGPSLTPMPSGCAQPEVKEMTISIWTIWPDSTWMGVTVPVSGSKKSFVVTG